MIPFPPPAHQSGQADLPYSTKGQYRSSGPDGRMRWRRQADQSRKETPMSPRIVISGLGSLVFRLTPRRGQAASIAGPILCARAWLLCRRRSGSNAIQLWPSCVWVLPRFPCYSLRTTVAGLLVDGDRSMKSAGAWCCKPYLGGFFGGRRPSPYWTNDARSEIMLRNCSGCRPTQECPLMSKQLLRWVRSSRAAA
jgi:hypothetical protein